VFIILECFLFGIRNQIGFHFFDFGVSKSVTRSRIDMV
jgi:hypothetical protein